MPVNIGKLEAGPGWGCSCLAYRNGEPEPGKALAALARSANVTVEDRGTFRDGTHKFWAWTDPENRYEVTFDFVKPGGWCKHIAACMVYWIPWFRQMALGAGETLEEIEQLRKELKGERRKRERFERLHNATKP